MLLTLRAPVPLRMLPTFGSAVNLVRNDKIRQLFGVGVQCCQSRQLTLHAAPILSQNAGFVSEGDGLACECVEMRVNGA